ncbi:MAG: MBL fold metallo-hydrolase [Gammaproteobacteria bacterium]|jgi:competence protein ComEC|nr:MBL fold metallo-hydrolase [Gammaproteobacteria bacterium]
MDVPSLWLHVLDVGQGLAVILQTPNHALVYDTGAGEDAETNLGKSVVVPVLKHLGIDSLDALIVSHGDTDHAGGIPGIMAALPVGRRYGSESVTGFKRAPNPVLPATAGHGTEWHSGFCIPPQPP